jgi:putative ABC transport system substrate-binding protein
MNLFKRIFISAGALLFLWLPTQKIFAQEIRLAILFSDSLETTLRTIKGVKSAVTLQRATINFNEFFIPARDSVDLQFERLSAFNPRLIITVGSYATKAAADRIKDKPIIFSAVLNPETSGFVKSLQNPGGNITGSSLDIPPDIQFKYFKRVIKDLKSIGVLYTSETENLIPPAQALAKSLGLELVAMKIAGEKEIPAAIDKMNRSVDAYWSVADPGIFSPNSTRFILLNALRNGKPFMGFSKNLVESGALFALDYDYKDIGRQAGGIALEVLSGKPPSAIPVAVPGVIWFHYNEKTARHINVVIPDDLAAVAKEVYR